jgi:hypothetical protein
MKQQKINIEKTNIVNKDSKIVISRLDKCKDTIDETVENCSLSTSCIAFALADIVNALDGNNPNIKAIAKCDDTDTFNEKRGKSISEKKAILKYHKRMVKDYDKYLSKMEKAVEEIIALRERHQYKIDTIEQDLENYNV